MSLKKTIEDAYKTWVADTTTISGMIVPGTSNLKEIYPKMKTLRDDLCKFADEFDKGMVDMSQNITHVESMKGLYGNAYQYIKDNFVAKVAEIGDFFIYGIDRRDLLYDEKDKKTFADVKKEIKMKYPDYIKEFKSKYKKLIDDFKQSKKLTKFLRERSSEILHHWPIERPAGKEDRGMGEAIIMINRCLDAFAIDTLQGIVGELLRKETEIFESDSNQKYFYTEKDSNILSRTIRYFYPDAWSRRAQKYDKPTIEPIDFSKDVRVFPTKESPKPSEVKQAGVGDCYLMAALIALAKTPEGKKAIEKCFLCDRDKIEDIGKGIDIRFYRLVGTNVGTVKIFIDRTRVIMPQAIKDGALWPKYIEKAYAMYLQKGYTRVEGESKSLDGGASYWPMFAITGKFPASSSFDPKRKREKFQKGKIIETIERKLGKEKAMTCAFKSDFIISDATNHQSIPIITNHVYAIVGFNKQKRYLRLIEPNKVLGRTEPKEGNKETKPIIKEGGHIAMSYEDFENNFEDIEYTSKKLPKKLAKLLELGENLGKDLFGTPGKF